ncbi:TPA: molecular chaperone [Proteus mirabilis]|nr:molecular chaperone [Proteus mirabilis]
MKYLNYILLYFVCMSYVQANGIGINASRIIYNGDSEQQPVTVRNTTHNETFLLKSSILKTIDMHPQTNFSVIPPLMRSEPETLSTFSIKLNNSSDLPTDRESLFLFSALAIPSIEKKKQNSLDVAFSVIVKVFYRPVGLEKLDISDMEMLSFKKENNSLNVTNPTPYYITLSELKVGENIIPMDINSGQTMISPFGNRAYPLNKTSNGKIEYKVIDDLGVEHEFTNTMEN